MTILSINPFNLKPAIKRIARKPKTVEIPPELPDSLYNKIAPLQNSLNYMATNYGLNFEFRSDCDDDWVDVSKNGHKEIAYIDYDNEADIARQIYSSASKILKAEDKNQNKKCRIFK